MKLASTLLLFAAATAPVFAQTSTTKKSSTVRRTPAHTTHTTACRADASQPIMPAAVPRVAGCTEPLYSLRYIDTVVGTGAPIVPRRWLTVAYTGYLLDGTKFDSSVGKDPITFPYGAHRVIPGWDTGFDGMKIGGKRRLFVPYQLAYGEDGRPPVIPGKSELIFDVELIGISETPPAPKTPPAPPQTPGKTQPPTTTPPPASAKPQSDAPPQPGAQPSAQQTVGQPTAKPAPTNPATPPTDPTKPAAVPPKP